MSAESWTELGLGSDYNRSGDYWDAFIWKGGPKEKGSSKHYPGQRGSYKRTHMWTAGARNCSQDQVKELAWDHTVYHGLALEGDFYRSGFGGYFWRKWLFFCGIKDSVQYDTHNDRLFL